MTDQAFSRGLARVSVTRAVALFLLAGLLVLLALTAVLAVVQRQTAIDESIRDARTLTNLEAHDVVGAALNDAALTPGPEFQQLDEIIRTRVLGALIVRVKIWDETGLIVYSDDAGLVGSRFALPDDELDALRTGQTVAEVSDLDEPENADERRFGKLLQVYLGVRTPQGQRLLFETYQPYDAISSASRRMWLASLPALIGGLVLLYLVQAPLAHRMATRLRSSQDEREQLLVSSLAASDRERSRLAADLHDGVVQGLVGASYTLDAEAALPCCADHDRRTQALHRTAGDLRRWVRELRSLIVTVTPPALHSQGLVSALTDLLATLEGRGIHVTLDADPTGPLPEDVEALVYRVAQEGVRNIVRHADAQRVQVALHVRPDRRGQLLELSLVDDGRGFDPSAVSRRHGSVGLELLTSIVAAQGGTLAVASAPATGTTLTLAVHLPERPAPASRTAVAGARPAPP